MVETHGDVIMSSPSSKNAEVNGLTVKSASHEVDIQKNCDAVPGTPRDPGGALGDPGPWQPWGTPGGGANTRYPAW